MESSKKNGMNRRTFIKTGVIGTATALIAPPALADTLRQMAASDTSNFPKPVYRSLGRTGLKISVVSFGAMLTPEPEVIRVAIEQGVNYINTARKYMGGKNEETVGKAVKGMRDRVFRLASTSRMISAFVLDSDRTLVAINTLSRIPFTALPTVSSFLPPIYLRAVLM